MEGDNHPSGKSDGLLIKALCLMLDIGAFLLFQHALKGNFKDNVMDKQRQHVSIGGRKTKLLFLCEYLARQGQGTRREIAYLRISQM